MKHTNCKRIMSAVLALLMLLGLLPVSVFAAKVTYTVNMGDLAAFAQGAKADGDILACGTDNFFTIFFSAKTRIDGSNKTFSDGVSSEQRLNFGGSTDIGDPVKNAVQVKTNGEASLKIWWVSGGDGREVAVYSESGEVVAQNPVGSVMNSLYITELTIPKAGTYYVGNVGGNNNFYQLSLTQEHKSGSSNRPAWSKVASPVITEAKDNGDGTMSVKIDALIGKEGGDELVVGMYDASGKLIIERKSIMERSSHTIKFTPADSGDYTFQARLIREGEKDKPGTKSLTAAFVLPLVNPNIISGTSKGDGKITVEWTAVKEATAYEILCDGKLAGTTDKTEFTVEGLTIGQKYSFRIVAIRGNTRTESKDLEVTATKEAKLTWGFTYYGPSTRENSNGYEGDLNESGSVTVFSEGGRGKIQPSSTDGVAFYYTAIPTRYNFTLRARVSVDAWSYSNGQEGFGLMATDRLGVSGDSSDFWNNQFMAVATKIEYRYDADLLVANPLSGVGTKYTMKLGLGTIGKTGVTKENLPKLEAMDTDTINNQFVSELYTLETAAGYWEKEAGTYNVIGNCTNAGPENIENAMLTEFILEIQKNNTGYFVSYYDLNGNLVAQHKYYGADALSKLDEDYVYAGFFASRNARATFSDVSLTTILASEDAPAEERPVTKIEPILTISSADVTTKGNYTLQMSANVAGTVKILMDGKVIFEGEPMEAEKRFERVLELTEYRQYRLQIQFTPDPDQDLGPDTVLSSTKTIYSSLNVLYNRGNFHRKNVYVSPDGMPNGAGTQEHPYDIYTAVNNVVPGQTIILMEGTYKLESTLKIARGMDGTEAEPIRMIADPAAKTRPVLDFQGLCAGIVHGGDYWYFAGFDVTRSQATQKGFQVSGSYNVLDQIHTYRNGNSGVQISRLSGADTTIDQWPAYNLILNCTSYLNADPGEEDADGFAAKLTCGPGNVFDGCVAYNNADDGWDLYAKVETGLIGAVTIRNCVAYNNGYRENGEAGKGNGNGFKMGGSSLSGYHVLENSVAFNNLAKGIDSNSCPDIIVKNCTSYNNGKYNVALYTNNAGNTDFVAEGIISFKDDKCASLSEGESLKPKGSQNEAKMINATTYYWDGSACVNSLGEKLNADIFVSLEFKGVARKADGTIDLQGFLELKAEAPANAGARPAGTPSKDLTSMEAEGEHSYSEEWTYDETQYHQYHWRECECGDRGYMEEHTFQWVIDKEVTADAPGQKHEECTVCHYKKPAIDVYPEKPDPTQPSTPGTTAPAIDPTEPAGTQPGGSGEDSGSPAFIIVIVVAVVICIGAALMVVLKKKK